MNLITGIDMNGVLRAVKVDETGAIIISEGTSGGKLLASGANTAPTGYAIVKIKALTTTVIASQTDSDGVTNVVLSGLTDIPAGVEIGGMWSAINLTSGEAIVYYAKL